MIRLTPRVQNATHVHVVYAARHRTVYDEVLCRKHFDLRNAAGTFGHGRDINGIALRPWTGEPRCADCEQDVPAANDAPRVRRALDAEGES